MQKDGQKLLNLMFLPEEPICVSNSQFGYHSVYLENALGNTVTLLPVLGFNQIWSDHVTYCKTSKLTMVALNPIDGYRRDINVKAYRNFLIELDIGTIDEQIAYIKRSGMPYSAMIHSGNKSVHTLISLDKDMPNEKEYRKIFQWICNILPLIDEKCINPSRSIRIPGAEREPGKIQKLLEFKGKVKTKDLADWLNKYPASCPQEKPRKKRSNKPDIHQLKFWAAKLLNDGIKTNRNHSWFSLGVEFCAMGFTEEETVENLEPFFEEESDFKEKEWLAAIYSGFKYLNEK